MTTLIGEFNRSASFRRETSRTAEAATTGEVYVVASARASAGTSSNWRFAACIASRQRATRSIGSSQYVGSSATIADTRFVHGSSSSPVRIDTGTIARSGSSGRASCSIRYSRNAPVQIAMTTSFSVPPVASFRRLRFESCIDRMAKRRCGVTLLFHGVGGAGVIGRVTDELVSPRS